MLMMVGRCFQDENIEIASFLKERDLRASRESVVARVQVDRFVASRSIRIIPSCRSPNFCRQGTGWLTTHGLHRSKRKPAARKTGFDSTGDRISLKAGIKLERSQLFLDRPGSAVLYDVRARHPLAPLCRPRIHSIGEEVSMSKPLLVEGQHLRAGRRYNAGCWNG